MINKTINLPNNMRLHLHFTKRCQPSYNQPLLPNLDGIKSTKKGSKFSRFFRHVFEHKNIKKAFGVNLAMVAATAAFVPTQASNVEFIEEDVVIEEKYAVLTTQKSIQYPVESVNITQGYRFYHPGIDLDGITGDNVKPFMAGYVSDVSYSGYGYGNAVLIDHGDNITSLYAHLSKIFVVNDQEVGLDTIIGSMGTSGRAYGDHLHLEIRDGGYPVNPHILLPR